MTENKLEKENWNSFNFFIACLLTLLGLISVYKTKGQTIFLPALIGGLILIFRTEFKNIAFAKFTRFSLIFCLFFLLYQLKIFFIEGGTIQAAGDHSFYAQVSAYINYTGIESYYFDYTNSVNKVPLPYHYGENWITILWSCLTGLNEFKAQELLTTPLLISAGAAILFFLFKKKIENDFYAFLFSLILTIGGSNFFWGLFELGKLSGDISGLMSSQYHMPKSAFSFFCSCAICYSVFSYDIKIRPSTLLVTCFATLGCVSFVPLLVLFCLIYVIMTKPVSIRVLLFPAFVLVYYVLFYLITSSLNSSNLSSISQNVFGECLTIGQYLKTNFNIVLKTIMQLMFLYFPFVAIVGLILIKQGRNAAYELVLKYRTAFGIVFFALIVGLLFWSLLWFSMGSISLFVDGGLAFFRLTIFLTIILAIIELLKESKRTLFVCAGAILIACFGGFQDFFKPMFHSKPGKIVTHFEQELKTANQPFIYLRDYNATALFQKNLLAFTSVGEISTINPKQQGVFVNISNIQRSKDCLEVMRENGLILSAPYSRYSEKNKEKNETVLLDRFIRENNIKYLFSEKSLETILAEKSIFLPFVKRLLLEESNMYVIEISHL